VHSSQCNAFAPAEVERRTPSVSGDFGLPDFFCPPSSWHDSRYAHLMPDDSPTIGLRVVDTLAGVDVS
jgi:hypothetical protein